MSFPRQDSGNSYRKPPAPPMINAPSVVKIMMAVMAIMHVARYLLPRAVEAQFIYQMSFIPARYFGNDLMNASLVEKVFPFFTYMFLHADIFHLTLNTLWLLVFGTPVARRIGTQPFLALFFLTGILGALLHLLLFPNSAVPMIGASGSISALMGAASRFALFPPFGTGISFSMMGGSGPLTPLTDRRLLAFTGVWLAINLIFGLGGAMTGPGQMVAWDVHLAGFFAGLLFFPYFDQAKPKGPRGDKKKRPSHLREVK